MYSRQILFGLADLHRDVAFKFCYRAHRFLRSFRESVPANASRRWLHDGGTPEARIFHGLNQRLPRNVRGISICTFHDLFVLTGDYSTPEFRSRFARQAREAAERADLIVCVSNFTATQVHELLGVEKKRLRTVPHGVNPPAERLQARARERMILHVGGLQARKNIVRLVEAFEKVLPGYRLVLAGGGGYGEAEIRGRIERSARRGDIDILGYVEDRILEELYARASVLAFPSLDEGFGIPVLEAMSRELPVLTSNVSGLPEAAGDAALLVNPLDTDEIAGGLNQLAEAQELRAALIARGLKRATQMTWRRAVEETWKIYQEVI